MMLMILHWFLTAVVLMFVSMVLPGIIIDNFLIALLATFVIGLINISLKPLILLLTLPLNILTLGLFALLVNAAMFALAGWLVPGFAITNFWSALFGSILLALGTFFIETLELKTA